MSPKFNEFVIEKKYRNLSVAVSRPKLVVTLLLLWILHQQDLRTRGLSQ